MLEEKDVQTQDEEAQVAESTEVESSTTQEDSASQKADNNIPYSRVKEMEDKARQKGREEAIRELLEEQSKPKEKEVAEIEEQPNEREEALRVLREAVRAELAPMKTRQEVKDFLDSNPDALSYVDKIKDLKRSNPQLNWEQAYKLASFDDKLKTAETAGIEKAEKGIASKRAAITEKPGSATQQKQKSVIERIVDRNVPLAQIEAELRNLKA